MTVRFVYRGRLVDFVLRENVDLRRSFSDEELLSVIQELEQKNGQTPATIRVGYS